MSDGAAYVGAAALALLACLCVVGAYRAVQRAKNLAASWEHKYRLAKLAYDVDLDDNAPDEIKSIIKFMADRAFDERFFAHILSAVKNSASPSQELADFKQSIKEKYGQHYAVILADGMRELSFIILFSDRALGNRARQGDPQSMRHMREDELRPIQSKIERDFVASDDRWSGMATA